MPVLLVSLEQNAVAGSNELDRSAATLTQAHTFGDEHRLAQWVPVPMTARPGIKWTRFAVTREGSWAAAMASMYTSPVNQSDGPLAVSTELRVICMVDLT